MKKLIIGRTDIYVDVEDTVAVNLRWLNPIHFNSSSVYKAGIMAKSTLHMFLHKKNAELVPKITAVLKTIKKEGLIEQYKQIAMEQQ